MMQADSSGNSRGSRKQRMTFGITQEQIDSYVAYQKAENYNLGQC
jgi:hypothetical protein